MTLQTLYDQLLELRIPGVSPGTPGTANQSPVSPSWPSKNACALLVDHKCTQCRENCICMQPACSCLSPLCQPGRTRSFSSVWTGTTHHPGAWTVQLDPGSPEHPSSSVQPAAGSLFKLPHSEVLQSCNGFTVRYHRTSRLLAYPQPGSQCRVPHSPPANVPLPGAACWFWMTGCGMPSRSRTRRIFWKSR